MLRARPHAIHFKRILDFGEGQVETSATHRYQLTHVFGAQLALQWHQFSDVLVDALPRDSGRRLWEIQVRVGTPRSGVEASVLEPSIEESHGCGRSDR